MMDVANEIYNITVQKRMSHIRLTQNVPDNKRDKISDEIFICGSNVIYRFECFASKDGTKKHSIELCERDYEEKQKSNSLILNEWPVEDYKILLIYLLKRQKCHTNWYLFVNGVRMYDCTIEVNSPLDNQTSFLLLQDLIDNFNVVS